MSIALAATALMAASPTWAAAPGGLDASPLAQARAAAAVRHAASAKAGSLDTVAPKLTAFSMSGTVDTQQPEAHANVSLTATDNQSGIQSLVLTLHSPSGAQSVARWDVLNSGVKTYSGDFEVGAQSFSLPSLYFTRFSEAGVWTVDSVFMTDLAGNTAFYQTADLAALGTTSVTVVNNGPYDNIPPILISGELGPKKVSLATPPAGTGAGQLPVLAAAVRGFDPGNGVSSGLAAASIEMCLPDPIEFCKDTFELDGIADGPGLADTTVRVSGSPRADQMPGKYVVYMVGLTDLAGNHASITTGITQAFAKGMSVTIQP